MSSLQAPKPLFGARRAVADAEAQLPFEFEDRLPRERVDLIKQAYRAHQAVQCFLSEAEKAAEIKVAYKKQMDRVITWEKCLLMLDAAGEFNV